MPMKRYAPGRAARGSFPASALQGPTAQGYIVTGPTWSMLTIEQGSRAALLVRAGAGHGLPDKRPLHATLGCTHGHELPHEKLAPLEAQIRHAGCSAEGQEHLCSSLGWGAARAPGNLYLYVQRALRTARTCLEGPALTPPQPRCRALPLATSTSPTKTTVCTTVLPDVLLEELFVEVVADCVVDEALLRLGLPAGLVLEHHVLVPPARQGARHTACMGTAVAFEPQSIRAPRRPAYLAY